MKTIAITAAKTAIVELSIEDLEHLQTLLNGASVYADVLIKNGVEDYCNDMMQGYYDSFIFPQATGYWREFYDMEEAIKNL